MASVIVVVFDGLQPKQVTSQLMPNLAAFAREGVAFTKHHPVYPTVTRTGVASIVTGCYPGRHGLAGNTFVARDFDPERAIDAMMPELSEVVSKTGRLLLVPALGEILASHDQEYDVISVGTTGNAYVHNVTADVLGGVVIHPEFCLPANLSQKIAQQFGRWPVKTMPDGPRMNKAVQILTEYIVAERRPAVSLIWFSEPDSSQHASGVGSRSSEQALGTADAAFGLLLEWLGNQGRAADTDILVTSDHGYSTIRESVDIKSAIQNSYLGAEISDNAIIVVPIGGSVLFYVRDKNVLIAEKLAVWLMSQPWCGPILASNAVSGITGTIAASVVGNEGDRAPDLIMSFAWDSAVNEEGFTGFSYSSSGAAGQGQHGSMSSSELNNVLFARGPNFKNKCYVDIPTGNIDITPTILHILGIPQLEGMDGRVLYEGLHSGEAPDPKSIHTEVIKAERSIEEGIFRQEISVTRVNSSYYIDSGKASLD